VSKTAAPPDLQFWLILQPRLTLCEELGDHEDLSIAPEERQAATQRSTWTSVVVNIVLTAVQLVVGVFSHSQALIADGIHSLSDLLSDFVVLLASHHSKKEADHDLAISVMKQRPRWCLVACCWQSVSAC
jgi:hypothetical protein